MPRIPHYKRPSGSATLMHHINKRQVHRLQLWAHFLGAFLFSSGTSKIICCIKIVIILQKKEVHGVLCERADGRKLSGLNLNSNSLKVGLAVLFLFSTRVYRRLQAATLEKL